jgi:hypothetical protein
MLGRRIGFGIHGDRLDAKTPTRADDATGNLAAIGNEDFSEHGKGASHGFSRIETDFRGFVVVKNTTLNLGARAEIQKQAQAQASRFQVVDELSFMCRDKLHRRFQFDEQSSFDHEISSELANHDIPKAHGQGKLLLYLQAMSSQFVYKSIFISAFYEPVPQFVVDGIKAPMTFSVRSESINPRLSVPIRGIRVRSL